MSTGREQFLEGMSRAACTVSVLTTDGPAGRTGITVSAMSSVSAEGQSPSLLVCVHHLSQACRAIRENGVFCVNILKDDQAHVSDTFAGRLQTSSGDRFDCGKWEVGETGAPLLRDALACFDCSLKHCQRWGTHFIFIGEVADIVLNDHVSPLVYANRAYGRTSPLKSINKPSRLDEYNQNDLAIGCFQTFGPYFLPRLLTDLTKQYPGALFKLIEGDQPTLFDNVESGVIEAALTYETELPDTLQSEVLAEIPPYILLSAEHPLAKKRQIYIENLVTEPMILLDIQPSHDYFMSLFENLGLSPNVRYNSPSFEMVRGLVGQNAGYSLLTTKPAACTSYDGKPLVIRSLAEPVKPSRLAVITRRGVRQTEIMNAFIDQCRTFLKSFAFEH